MSRLQETRRQIRQAKCDQRDDDDHGGQGKRDRQGARMFRSKPIRESENEQHPDSGKGNVVLEKFEENNVFCPGDDISQTRPSAQRRGYGQVRN